jgi:acyl transferase domain-containing protein/acyl carrier protein
MSRENQVDLEVAVIGMAGRFPGAQSVDAFWRNLRSGVESIRDLSEDELQTAGVDREILADPRLVRRAADLQDADLFDAGLFGFSPREAELMDPQFRVFLEDAWAALENAGYLSERHDARIGVFAGAGPNSYLLNNVYSNPQAAQSVGAFQTSIGNERDYLATHVSYRLDLRGPSLAIQTACSTSLVAVHLACQSLLSHECDVALAGGVSVSVPQTWGYLYEEGGIASPDGRCRAFDEAASGCVKGNGSALVVLRRLADALRDGDTIRAIIKGSAVNNDGTMKVGFTAPSDEGQAGVIAEALAAAGVEPSAISYVEAHGTGTTLGDPVELAALARAFGSPSGRSRRCAIGSVKTNVGHLDAAAGVAGLIKTILALENREIPPSLHFQRPNPKMNLASTPFYVNAELRSWTADGGPRRAGVSSFGIGGTNAHVILEEPPPAPAAARARPAQLLLLSARTESALAASSEALRARLGSDCPLDLADAAYTLQVGRKRLPWRRALVAQDAAQGVTALASGTGRGTMRHHEGRGAEVAFLFPGQGAQHAGMAAGLHRHEPVFRRALDRCAETLRPLLDLDLREVIFPRDGSRSAAEERLRQTSLAQPALFAVEYSLGQLWISWGVRPVAMAGHSIGEYVAATLAGVMSPEDALQLVAERGRLMGTLPSGAMLAVPVSEADLATRLARHPGLAIAAVNGPSSCVASGAEAAIARLEQELEGAGVAHRRVHTSHAFHSAMMDPILDSFASLCGRVHLQAPSIPFLSNVTGGWISDEQAIDPAYWAGHVRRTVRFADNVAILAEDPSRVLLEVGPGTSLSSLAKQQAGPETIAVASLRHPREGGDDEIALLEALGKLWCAGVDVDWAAFHEGYDRRRIPLPTYPFERRRYWIEAGPATAGPAGATASPKNADLGEWFYAPGWKRSLPRDQASPDDSGWMVFDDGSELAGAVVDRARGRGGDVVIVRPGAGFAREEGGRFRIDPRRGEDYEELMREVQARGSRLWRVAHLWCADAARVSSDSAQDLGFFSLLHLFQAIGAVMGGGEIRIAAVAGGIFDVTGEAVLCPERATLVGACRVAPQEYPGMACRVVDVSGSEAGEGARCVAVELDSPDNERVVAWRGGHRWVPAYERIRLEPVPAEGEPWHAGEVFLLTGGTGPLELGLAARLIAAGAKGVAFLECESGAESSVEALRAGGAAAMHCSRARVTDRDALAAAVAQVRERFGRLDAVFHTAGAIGGGMIQLKEREAAWGVLSPRLQGARFLAEQLRDGEMLVLFSSAISATGVFGQVDYCAASAYLDAFAHSRRHGSGPRVVALDWGTAHWDRWQDTAGLGSEALREQLREIQDAVGITVEEGVEALQRALALGAPQLVVSPQDLDELVAQSGSSSVAEFLEEIGGVSESAAGGEGREVVALASDTERQVAGVWSRLLGIAKIGRNDSFFDLGGNSLLAIQLASHLRKEFDIDLTIASLFESADLASLAAAVDAAGEERRQAQEVARVLEEIEALSEEEIRSELDRGLGVREVVS